LEHQTLIPGLFYGVLLICTPTSPVQFGTIASPDFLQVSGHCFFSQTSDIRTIFFDSNPSLRSKVFYFCAPSLQPESACVWRANHILWISRPVPDRAPFLFAASGRGLSSAVNLVLVFPYVLTALGIVLVSREMPAAYFLVALAVPLIFLSFSVFGLFVLWSA